MIKQALVPFSIVVSARNEEETIRKVLRGVRDAGHRSTRYYFG